MNSSLTVVMRTLCTLLLALLVTNTGASQASPPLSFVRGAYEVFGRLPGDFTTRYHGWVRMAPEADNLEMIRCISGDYVEGTASMTVKTADRIPALDMAFELNGHPHRATCSITSDFDNLPRLMCLTFPVDNPSVEIPGVESYFPIVWPVPVDYFDCN